MSSTIKVLDLNRKELAQLDLTEATWTCAHVAYRKWLNKNNRSTSDTSWDFTQTAVIVTR